MKISYYGHSAFMLDEGKIKIFIDPYLRGNGIELDALDISNLSHIFVTHGHSDHLGDTIELALKTGALVVSNAEIIRYLKSKGLENTHSMYISGSWEFTFGRVKMTTALHGSGIYEGDLILYGGNPCGYLLNVGGKKIYHAGDTGLSYEMKLLEDENIDIAMLPIGGNYTMDIDDALKAIEFIKPKKVIPMHFLKKPLIDIDPCDFAVRVKEVDTIVLREKESVEI